MELFTATSPFANHQPTTVPVWAQNSSLQTRLHMIFTSENYLGVNLLTYLLTYTCLTFSDNVGLCIIMLPSSLGGAALCVALCLSACPSVCLSVCQSVPLSLPSVTSRHLANCNDTCTFRHALRAAYRTAISAAQILVIIIT